MFASRWIVTVGLLGLSHLAWAVEASISLPDEPVATGEMFEIPVYVTDGEVDLASYALRINYAPDIFNVVEISGGVFGGFNGAPVTDPDGFASGATDFTAVNAGFRDTPDMFEVARIRMKAVGRPGDTSDISLAISPNGGLVDSASFGLVQTVLLGGGQVGILDDGTGGQPPNAPANLVGRSKASEVSLGWMGSDDAEVFRVFRMLIGEDEYSEIGETVNRAFMDTIPSGLGFASYYVVAQNVYGDSPQSSAVGVTVQTRSRSRSRR